VKDAADSRLSGEGARELDSGIVVPYSQVILCRKTRQDLLAEPFLRSRYASTAFRENDSPIERGELEKTRQRVRGSNPYFSLERALI
jgi:hypothetical protein